MEHRSTFWSLHFMSLLFLCCLLSGSNCGIIRPVPWLPMVNYSRPGNLTLGVVTSVHKSSATKLCGNAIETFDRLQRIEAIAFAVEEINNRSDLLPNITLGFAMFDDCSNAEVTVLRGLQLVQNPPNSESSSSSSSSTTSLPSVSAVAVIGADSSWRTIRLASLLSVYKVPLLSYMAAGPLLDDRELYPFFTRIIPSNRYQAAAVVDILQEMDWTYVSVIYGRGFIDEKNYLMFRKQIDSVRYCLATKVPMPAIPKTEDYKTIIYQLLQKPEAHVVVLFLNPTRYVKLIKAAFDLGKQDHFIWLVCDITVPSLYNYIGNEAFMHGVLAVSFMSCSAPRFDERFKRMTLGAAAQNPWFKDFVSSFLNCSLNMSSVTACNPDREIGTYETYFPDWTVSLAIDAVYAWAYALDELMKNCTDSKVNNCVKPKELLHTLWKLDFPTKGHNILFDETRSGMTNYRVLNFVSDNNTLVFSVIGEWNLSTKTFSFFRKDLIRWRSKVSMEGNPQGDVYPESVCSKPCPIGYKQVSGDPHCCFKCDPCADNERTVVNYSTNVIVCQTCPTKDNFTWPDEKTRTACLPIEASYELDWRKYKGIIILTFNAMLLCSTTVTAVLYVRNSDEDLIKSTSLGMGMATLLGHGLMCVLIFSFVLFPTIFSCIAITLSIHLSFPLSYALLMVRVNRIYNICILNSTTTSKALFNSARSQVVFGIIFVVLQVLTSSLSIGLQPPWTKQVMYDQKKRYVDKVCSIQYTNMLGPVLLNILGMIVCTIRAIQIRGFQVYSNEPRFIIFHLLCTAMMWLCFEPTYPLTKRLSDLLMSVVFVLFLQMISCQALLFLPKLYVIYLSPSSSNSCSTTDLTRSGSTVCTGDIISSSGAITTYSGAIMPRSGAQTSDSGVISLRSGTKLPWKTE